MAKKPSTSPATPRARKTRTSRMKAFIRYSDGQPVGVYEAKGLAEVRKHIIGDLDIRQADASAMFTAAKLGLEIERIEKRVEAVTPVAVPDAA